jgi:hypothetical protein
VHDEVDQLRRGSEIGPQEEEVGAHFGHAATEPVVEEVAGDDRHVGSRVSLERADLSHHFDAWELVAFGVFVGGVDDYQVDVLPLRFPGQCSAVVDDSDYVDLGATAQWRGERVDGQFVVVY